MSQALTAILEPRPASATPPMEAPPFGPNEMRLGAGQWLMVLGIVAAVMLVVPRLWKSIERFDTGADYRIPYQLSKDYWLWERRLEKLPVSTIPVIGDSVIWGEYVRPDGTLSHFLGEESGRPGGFANCGVNGLFPLAMEGLVEHYANSLHGRKVIVFCNVGWMSSPKQDLSIDKEETFNHSRLVPQFFPRIPCYRAEATERLSGVIERDLGFEQWVSHLQAAYFDQMSIPGWTLADDGRVPPRRPNAWRNPLAQVSLSIPREPAEDTQRGPESRRHRPWFADGTTPMEFEWVGLDASLQWRALQRTLGLLRQRGSDVVVILGPFNEHMIAPQQRPEYGRIREGIVRWLEENGFACIAPEVLPSELYADASHPLTRGYALLAKRICEDSRWVGWLKMGRAGAIPVSPQDRLAQKPRSP